MTIKMKIQKLINLIDNKDNNKEIEMVEIFAKDCADYISCIVNMENEINLAEVQLDQAQYKEFIETIDKKKIAAHNSVIGGCKVLNKMSQLYNVDPIYPGDINSDSQVAKFAKEYIDELFNERRL